MVEGQGRRGGCTLEGRQYEKISDKGERKNICLSLKDFSNALLRCLCFFILTVEVPDILPRYRSVD